MSSLDYELVRENVSQGQGHKNTRPKAAGTLLPLLVAVSLGTIVALSPAALGIVAVILALVLGGGFLIMQPRKALVVSFFLVMVAETKFRTRDPMASLSGNIDSQISFELVLYAVISLIILINFLSIPRGRLKPAPMEVVLLGYVMLALFSIIWSYNATMTAVRGAQLFTLFALCFVAVRVFGPPRLLEILTVSVVLYVLSCSLMALVFPWARGASVNQVGRLPGFTWFSVHPGAAANYATTAAILIISNVLFGGSQHRWKTRFALWLSIIPLVHVLIATRARSQFIAFVSVVLILALRKYVNPLMTGFVAYVVLALSVIWMNTDLSFTNIMERLLGHENSFVTFLLRGQTTEQFLGVSGRAELWRGIYALVLNRPILGYGYMASRDILLTVAPWAGTAHNALAETLLGLGAVGTVLIWFALGRTLFSSLQTVRSAATAWYHASSLGILVYFLVSSFTSSTFAGVPGYDVSLFFAYVLAHERLRLWQESLGSKLEAYKFYPAFWTARNPHGSERCWQGG
jgi:hypothetical protein